MEGKGKVTVTDIGEKISLKENDIDYNNALISAVNRVPLWGIIFTKYTKVGKEIQEDKFWSELREHCDLTVEESQKRAPEILKWYREDTKMINLSLLVEKTPPVTNESSKSPSPDNADNPSDDVLVISYGKYNVTLPNEFSEREDVGEILKSMIDISVKPKKIKSELDKVKNIEENHKKNNSL